jgi:DNA-binding MarR family transcriptional regulator
MNALAGNALAERVSASPSKKSPRAASRPGRPVARKRAASVSGLDLAQLQRLAEFRFQLRRFLHFSTVAAEQAGLRNQQYQMLQCVGGMPDGMPPTIANVAARMLLKHNSAVELVDRAIDQGLMRRSADPLDHRCILLRVTPEGERLLASLAEFHMQELEQSGPELVRALHRVLNGGSRSYTPRRAPSRRRRGAA